MSLKTIFLAFADPIWPGLDTNNTWSPANQRLDLPPYTWRSSSKRGCNPQVSACITAYVCIYVYMTSYMSLNMYCVHVLHLMLIVIRM